jgi:hypothetical protein
MLLKVFAFPKENSTFQDEFLFQTNNVVSYEYTKKFVGTGNFTLVLAIDKAYANRIIENCILNYNGDWLFVNNVKRDDKQITLSGTDLNGFLDLRITIFGETQVAGAKGYDVVKGTTGECVNHYLNNNAINPEDKSRRIPRLVIGQTAQGKAKDNYMARLQVLTEVIGNLCENATIGYEITADTSKNQFVFNTLVGTDRSIQQSDNTAVIFSQARNNLFSATYERGNEDLLNAIYATGADVTQTVYRNGNTPTGVLRHETAIDVSVDSVADIKDYALKQVNGNISNNSYELDIRGIDDYGKKYKLGDYVTVMDTVMGKAWTAQIIQITTRISSNEHKISLTLGDTKTKLLNKIQNSVTINNYSESSKNYNSLNEVVTDVTATITGANGGYVIMHTDEDGRIYEILILNTPEIKTATKVWRWNSGGFGFSDNGYDGPYETAMTMDGVIIADFIAAGTLKGVKIIADKGSVAGWEMENGVLVSDDGSMKLDSVNNTITVNDSGGSKLMTVSKDGIRFWRGNTEIGQIGIRGGAEGNYGLTFDLVDGDAMTWSVYDKNENVYVNKLRYTEKDGLTVHNNLSCRKFMGHDIVKCTYTNASGDVIKYWGWSD